MTCVHCGLPHPSDRCNRPEGIAARGAVLRMSERPIGWREASRESVLRGSRKGGRIGWRVRAERLARRREGA